MISYERQSEILKILKEKHISNIAELSKAVWASESSVRRDVRALEQKGLVIQMYGGVALAAYGNSVVPLSLRDSSNASEKELIAKKAAELVHNGDTIFMDGSSTVRRMVKYLTGIENLKIITNNLKVFADTSALKHRIYCTGGLFESKNNIFAGSGAEKYIRSVHADVCFFSSQAISDDGEISDASEKETELRKVMLERSDKKIFLCDSSKLGKRKTFTLCTKDDVDCIICDKSLPWETDF